MTLKTFEMKLPPLFYSKHMAMRLEWFIDRIMERHLGRSLKDPDKKLITMLMSVDGGPTELEYDKKLVGYIKQVGSDFVFQS